MILLNPQNLFFIAESYVTRPLFSLDGSTFVSMIPNLFNFVLVVVFMTYLLHKPIRKILKTRADRITQDLSEANEKSVRAQELKAEYEKKLQDIEVERVRILDETRRLANANRESTLNDAKLEAQELKDRANRDIEAERTRVKDEVHQAIIDISTSMAEKLISATIDKTTHDKLFAEAMADLEATVFRSTTVELAKA
jgi:F-type H+-transporting ATPase subunit b